MTQPGSYNGDGLSYDRSGYSSSAGGPPEGHERGSRRKKLAGYWKAANELRQSYQQSRPTTNQDEGNGDHLSIPGSFPDVSIVRYGDEELILFPSYCKRHIREKSHEDSATMRDRSNGTNGSGDAEYWKREWERFQDDKAIVDVDVRGWLYSPHRGPMSRKHRILIGLARQLSGVPAPRIEASKSRESSPDPRSLRSMHEAHEARKDRERIEREAEEILKKGMGEQDIAAVGGYSENPTYDSDDGESIYNARGRSRRGESPGVSSQDGSPGPGSLPKRESWTQPSNMSNKELAIANSNLMTRLRPFMTNPMVSSPVTIFFYDEKQSQSKTVMTNEAGHFNIRAPLDFMPTDIRVIASEHLSATMEVKITEPKGVSLISDVDDTIKHSSIGSGPREIFRNAFIRDLSDLTIDGVKEWYNTMFDMGVGIHYVSNSPWQLFPVLASFFQVSGLPPGSYHLKQYSGMLQGIFEPVAERKKGTLERILRDFPERRFLLIGDSGEADLEVYTDVVIAHPKRIIGVFIRDVTSPPDQGFFDSAMGPLSGDVRNRNRIPVGGFSGDRLDGRLSSSPDNRPPLPPRISTEPKPPTSGGPTLGKLIDFDDEPVEISINESHRTVLPRSMSDFEYMSIDGRRKSAPESSTRSSKTPPQRPVKPLSLRSTTSSNAPGKLPSKAAGVPPPLPPPRSLKNRPYSIHEDLSTLHPLSQTQNTSELSPPHPNQGYLASAKEKVNNVYNALPPASSYLPTRASTSHSTSASSTEREQPPRPPPRRGVTAAAAAAYATNRLSWKQGPSNSASDRGSTAPSMPSSRTNSAETSDDESYSHFNPSSYAPPSPRVEPINKKLDMWKRRWARAKSTMDAHGVELRSWRMGQDVCLDAIRLVEKNMREMGVEGYGDGARKGTKGKTGEGGGEMKVKDLKN